MIRIYREVVSVGIGLMDGGPYTTSHGHDDC